MDADPRIGTVLAGRYRLERLVGRGATGRVYAARQLALGRLVAVKLMRPDVDPAERRAFEERFLREASLAGSLQHPNVVTVHDFGRTEDGACFVVMELLEGRSLSEELRGAPLSPARVLEVFEQVLRGLRAAHAAGLVHRDMKPGNVLLVPGDDGRDLVKIVDFGLVRPAAREEPGEDEPTEVTRGGTFLGTPHYAAPEQVRGRGADARSDVYAVGVMLYRALTGVLPYMAGDPMAIARMHLEASWPPMAERAPGVAVPPELEAIVHRAMEKDPARRWADAGEMLAALAAARRRLGHAAPPPPPRAPATPPAEERRRGGGRRLLSAAGLLLALGAGGGLLLLGGRRPAGPPASAEAAAPPPASPSPVDVPAAEDAPADALLVVTSEPPGARVLLGDRPLGTTPLLRRLEPPPGAGAGPVVLRLRREGYEEAEVAVDLSGGGAEARVVLEPLPAEAGRAPAREPSRRAAGRAPLPSPPAAEPPGKGEKAVGAASAGADGGEPARDASSAPPAGAGAVLADGVRFSAEEAAAALRFANEADREQLLAAGVAPRQAAILLDGRPFADLESLAATPWIGRKTLEALRRAAAR